MDRFLDLLNSVKKKNNSTFHSCEPELIELMRQIDEMIELKNQEWKTDVDHLEGQLNLTLNENAVLTNEVERLKSNLTQEQKAHSQTLSQYEKDVRQLKNDMSKLKRRYVELQMKIERANKKKMVNVDGDSSFDTLKPMVSEAKSHKHKSPIAAGTSGDKHLKSDNLVLNLKIESLLIENDNLRTLLREQSNPIFGKQLHTYNSTLCSSADSHTFPTKDNNGKETTEDTINSTGFEIPKSRQKQTKGKPQQSSSSTSSSQVSGLTNMEYFEGDCSLEDKMNNILSEFEAVSSSMVLS